KVRVQAIVNAVVQIAAALLITLATAGGAAAAGARVAAALATEESAFALRAVAFAANVATNVTINTAVQLAISQPTHRGGEGDGSVVGSMLLENLLMEVFLRGLSQPLHDAERVATAEAHTLSALPHLTTAEREAVSSFSFAGAQMAVEVVGGVATQWA